MNFVGIDDLVNDFNKLNEHNNTALDQLKSMSLQNNSSRVNAVNNLFESIRGMFRCIKNLTTEEEKFYNDLKKFRYTLLLKERINDVESEALRKISLLFRERRFMM